MKPLSKFKEIAADIVTDPIVFTVIILITTCYFMITGLIGVNTAAQDAQWSSDRAVSKVYRANGEDGNDSKVRIVASRLPKNAVAEQSIAVKNEQDSDQDVEVLYDVYNQKVKSLDLFKSYFKLRKDIMSSRSIRTIKSLLQIFDLTRLKTFEKIETLLSN